MVAYPQIRTSADLLKSTIRLEELIPFLQQQKAEACAIVNSKLYGLLPFWRLIKQASIHPVIGLTVRVQFEEDVNLPLILYAQTNEGYNNLLKISSAISIRDDEVLPFRWLKGYSKGCIAIIPVIAENGSWLHYEQFGMQLANVFQEQLYIGISRGFGIISTYEESAIEFSRMLQTKIIAIHECLFLKQEDFFAYTVAQSIESGIKLNERTIHNEQEQHFVPTKADWEQWFYDQPHWLNEMKTLLKSCQIDIETNHHYMPKYPVKDGMTAEQLLSDYAVFGLKQRLQTETLPIEYSDRLNYELQTIFSMGYADYFLIVADFMNFAKKENILTGPGRGSSASSLVAYSLYITQVDPLQYGLLFERFLNPERVTLPDIDIDFIDTRRQEVIQYVAKKYGNQHVAQIITFGTLSAKAVARDVARMFNFENETLEMISKLIPNKLGITLQQAYEDSQTFKNWVNAEPIRVRWFETAKKLEGLPRNASTHAAGVVLSPVPLVNVIPIEKGHDDIYLTQWPMQEVEQIGLLKMDFLGLRNLTILDQILKSIYFSHHRWIQLNEIPLNDEKTFELLRQGDTTGIFQLESDGMKKALIEISPSTFLDIVAVNALYRPGPMDFIPLYARRKKNLEQVHYLHPIVEPILKETYGIIVYQEQIMQIAHRMAGFSLGQADLLRRAVSKKNRDVLEKERSTFVQGSVQNGFSQDVANQIYEMIVRFADYGFAKSHAVAYSIISYQMAYLKANYPLHFYAALMTNAIGNQEKLFNIMMEAKRKGIEFLNPSIQKSKRIFTVENGKIRFSLSCIKGVPQPFLKKLVENRKSRTSPFEDLFDFAVSMSAKYFNLKVIEQLIKAGALDEFNKDRAVLLASIDAAQKHAEIVRPTEEDDLFSNTSLFGKPKYVEVDAIPLKMKLQFEKEALGFYLSEHPVTSERTKISEVNCHIGTMNQTQPNQYVKLVGMVEKVHQIRTKNGDLMAFIQIEDEFGTVSTTVFPKQYKEIIGWIKNEKIVYVEGIVEKRNGKVQIKVKIMKNIH